jgi:hypothetical protein
MGDCWATMLSKLRRFGTWVGDGRCRPSRLRGSGSRVLWGVCWQTRLRPTDSGCDGAVQTFGEDL